VTANVRLFDFISFFFILFTGSKVITYTCNFFDWLLRLKGSRSKVGSDGVRVIAALVLHMPAQVGSYMRRSEN
jgi:hypothetical protein